MLRIPEPIDLDEDEEEMPALAAPLRVLADWIAQHAGIDPRTGALIDRGFAVMDLSAAG